MVNGTMEVVSLLQNRSAVVGVADGQKRRRQGMVKLTSAEIEGESAQSKNESKGEGDARQPHVAQLR